MSGTQILPTVPGTGGGGATLTWPGWFGDAADGDFTVVPVTSPPFTFSPARERNYNNLTIQPTANVAVSGFRIFVNGQLRNEGIIQDNGTNADLSSGGAGLGATQYLRGNTGAGPNGGSSTANGNTGGASSNASFNNSGVAPNGGAGGGAGVQTGGAGGAASTASTRWSGQLFQARQQVGAFGGGAGGGSGAVVTGGAGANGGGGGGGGGVVWVAARTIDNTGGVISARGGNGGNGSGFGAGIAGGGGGGGGGLVGIVSTTPSASMGGTISASGGTGGTGFNGGGAGVAGTAGSVNYLILG
jgi:hypothetical protein